MMPNNERRDRPTFVLRREGLHHVTLHINFEMLEMLGYRVFVYFLDGYFSIIPQVHCLIDLGVRAYAIG